MTVWFWIIACSLIFSVLAVLAWPLLNRSGGLPNEEERESLGVYRQQFAELEQDRTTGLLTEDQYVQAKAEWERRVLEETGGSQVITGSVVRPVNTRGLALALIMVIPLVSIVLYWKLGNPLALTHPQISTMGPPGVSEVDHQTTVGLDALTERLRQRLEQNPGDGLGLALLARSYVELGRHAEAVPIYERAAKLMPDDPQLLADYADALGVLHGRRLEGKPEALIQQALRLDPRHVKALMLAGTVAFDRKHYAKAASYWEQAQANLPPDADPEVVHELSGGIEEALGFLGNRSRAVTATPPIAKAPSRDTGSAMAITGTVKLVPSLEGKGVPDDTLFVFARSVDGPPMPVAIVRATKRDLPFAFRLDDATSPMPSRKLSDMDRVVVVARLSKSGDAMPKPGDLQGVSEPLKPGRNGLTIIIDRELP